jgi:hypothetical protein
VHYFISRIGNGRRREFVGLVALRVQEQIFEFQISARKRPKGNATHDTVKPGMQSTETPSILCTDELLRLGADGECRVRYQSEMATVPPPRPGTNRP